MKRVEELAKQFPMEPCVQANGVELMHLEKGMAIIRVTVLKSMVVLKTTKSGKLLMNGAFFVVFGNTAGVYAAMSRIPHGHTTCMGPSCVYKRKAVEGEILITRAWAPNDEETGKFIGVHFRVEDENGILKAKGFATYIKPEE